MACVSDAIQREVPDVGEQHEQDCCCMGGHLSVPYEQKTQQSPALGLSTAWQRSHS